MDVSSLGWIHSRVADDLRCKFSLYLVLLGWITMGWAVPKIAAAQPVPDTDTTRVSLETGHSQSVSALAFSPNRRFLASAGEDRTIKIWDVARLQVIRTLTGNMRNVTSIAFSPDGQLLVSGSEDGAIRVWNTADNWTSKLLAGTGTPTYAIVFSNNGHEVISGDLHGFIRVLNASTGAEIVRLQDHGVVKSLAVSPLDGALVASGTSAIGANAENAAHLWDVSTGKEMHKLSGFSGEVSRVVFSPDGNVLLAESYQDGYKAWDVNSGKELQRSQSEVRHLVGFDTNGRLVTLGVFEVYLSKNWSGAEEKKIEGPHGLVAALSSDAKILATSGSYQGDVRFWDISTGHELPASSQPRDPTSGIAISRDGHMLASVTSSSVHVWDLSDSSFRIFESGSFDLLTNVIFSPDGSTLVAWGTANGFTSWDIRSGKTRFSAVGHKDRLNCVVFDPRGENLASASDDHTIRIWNASTGKLLRTINAYAVSVTSIAYSDDGSRLISSGSEIANPESSFNDRSAIKVWDARTGKELKRFVSDGLTSLGSELLVTPDQKLLVSAHFRQVWLQNSRTGRVVRELPEQADVVNTIAISPDGRWVASGDANNSIDIWDLTSGYQTRSLDGHTNQVNGVAFALTRTWLASAANDGTLQIWDVRTGKPLASLISFRNGKDWVVIVGDKFFSGSPGGEAQVSLRDQTEPQKQKLDSLRDRHALWGAISSLPTWSTWSAAARASVQPEVVLSLSPGFDQPAAISRILRLKLHVSAGNIGSGIVVNTEEIGEVQLLQNNRPVRTWSGDLHLDRTGQADIEENVTLEKGLNEFSAFATSHSGARSARSRVSVITGNLAPDLVVQSGHVGTINDVRFSFSGSLMASAGQDRAVILWDAATGRQLRRLLGHTGPVMSVSFSPDGILLASSGSDSSVVLWEVATGRRLRTLTGHGRSVLSVIFSPNGRLLATGSQDYTLGLWDTTSGREIRTLEGHQGPISCVAFSSDGRLLASASLDKTVRIWNVSTGRTVWKFVHSQPVAAVAFSPNNRVLVSGEQLGTLRFWDTNSGKQFRSLERASSFDAPDEKKPFLLDAVSFSPDGRWLVSSDGFLLDRGLAMWLTANDVNGTIKVFDSSSGVQVGEIKDSVGVAFRGASFSPDGKRLAWGDNRGRIQVSDISNRSKVRKFSGQSSTLGSMAISPSGKMLASGGNRIHLWNLSDGVSTRALDSDGLVDALAFSPDEDHLASESSGGTLRFHNLTAKTRKSIAQNGQDMEEHAVAFSPDGRWLASTGNKDYGIRIWEASTGKLAHVLGGIDRGELLGTASFSDDGKLLIGASSKLLTLWQTDTWKQLRIINTEQENLKVAVFAPGHNAIAAAGLKGTIDIWDESTGIKRKIDFGNFGPVYTLAFSPGGDLLASAGSDTTIRISDSLTGKLLRTLSGHDSGISAVSFLPSRNSSAELMLASTGEDGTVRLWNVRSGNLLATLLNPGSGTNWVVVTPDGLFDGTADAMQQVAWRVGNTNEVTPVDAFFTDFYLPGLLGQIVAGEHPRAVMDIVTSLQVPGLRTMLSENLAHLEKHGSHLVVCFDQKPGAVINVGATDRRLFFPPVNGYRPGTTATCKFEKDLPTDDGDSTGLFEQLQKEKPEVVTTSFDGLPSETNHSTLHVLTIGISQYPKASGFDPLPYAVPSAEAIERFFREQEDSPRRPYAAVKVWEGLYDADATRDKLRQRLSEMSKEVAEEDVVLLYLAGHGKVAVGEEMFYFVPVDGQDAELRDTGLNTAMIADAVRNLPARRVVLIVDACQSGGAIEALGKIGIVKAQVEQRRDQQERNGSGHEHGVGVHLIAATLPLSYAVGRPAGKSSLLAETILNSLRDMPAPVTIDQLSAYVRDQLPTISEQVTHFRQVPLIDSIGLDFPISAR